MAKKVVVHLSLIAFNWNFGGKNIYLVKYYSTYSIYVQVVCSMYWNRGLDSISPSRHFGLLGDAVKPVLVSTHLDLLSSIKRRWRRRSCFQHHLDDSVIRWTIWVSKEASFIPLVQLKHVISPSISKCKIKKSKEHYWRLLKWKNQNTLIFVDFRLITILRNISQENLPLFNLIFVHSVCKYIGQMW